MASYDVARAISARPVICHVNDDTRLAPLFLELNGIQRRGEQFLQWPLAETGSGKTLAYLAPVFSNLLAGAKHSSTSRIYLTRFVTQNTAKSAHIWPKSGRLCTAVFGPLHGRHTPPHVASS